MDSIKETVRVVHHVHREHTTATSAYFVFANEHILEKWRTDRTIPLVDVVQAFSVFQTENGGATGKALTASHADLKSHFGTDKVEDVIVKILENGRPQHVPTDKHAGKAHMNGAPFKQVMV
ncbi:hypothetical protein HK101_000848 [Irineochytrium annulatum]|nr:hypothetical protein HK101_000848 [Irineochytrium annulatum]